MGSARLRDVVAHEGATVFKILVLLLLLLLLSSLLLFFIIVNLCIYPSTFYRNF